MEINKVEVVNKSFDELVRKLVTEVAEKESIWKILIPLLIGAGISILTQLIIEYCKTSKEKKLKIKELISKAKGKTYMIAQTLKILAMYKTQKQYYIRAFEIVEDEKVKDDNFKKHYDKANGQRLTEQNLAEKISEYFEIVTEYIILSKSKYNYEEHFKIIFDYEHPKAGKFENCKTEKELVAQHPIVESKLNKDYLEFRNLFIEIQTSMK